FAGGGPDAAEIGGGFDAGLKDSIFNVFGQHLPIVSYEGGPSLYTDSYDQGDPRDDGITTFISMLNRQPAFAEVYRIQLNMALSKGLNTHALFVDNSKWGKFGQWGHLEYPDQPPGTSVKWTTVKNWQAQAANLRNLRTSLGGRPAFDTPETLPSGLYNVAYDQVISASAADGGPAPSVDLIGSVLVRGLRVAPVPGLPNQLRLTGAPQEGGWSYLYLRATGADGDATWRVYSMLTQDGPGVLFDADFSGSFSGAADLPAASVNTIDPRVSWSGLNVGAGFSSGGGSATGSDGTGVKLHAQDGALRFSVAQGGENQSDSTLASALTDNEYRSFTLTPAPGETLDLRGAELRLRWICYAYHAPRAVSVFSSISGFAEADVVATDPNFPPVWQPGQVLAVLPETAAYANVAAPVSFRLVFHGSQYAHQAGILDLKLGLKLRPVSYAYWAAGQDWAGAPNGHGHDADQDGLPNLIEYAMGASPTMRGSGSVMPQVRQPAPAPGAPILAIDYRRRMDDPQLNFTVQGSPDLSQWDPLPATGSNTDEIVLDPDPTGDGSYEQRRFRVHPGLPYQFFRFSARTLP
ncbi:MAG: hypothetical protein GVY36_01850, partial [Verrucomicrobia bacterium]|nr:hypothetical protein [Verrucomicrobiota bacterium]